jgi:tetratricopeptide (TPR) repeat protein
MFPGERIEVKVFLANIARMALAVLFGVALFLPASATPADDQARQLLAAGRADEAIQMLNAILDGSPNDAEAHHLLSRVYYTLEHWDQSITEGQRAVAAEPNSSDYHLWLGRAYGMKAEHSGWFTALKFAKKTRAEFEQAVELDNANVQAHSDLAEYYLEAPGFLGGGDDKARREAEKLAAYNASAAHWVKAQLAEKDKNYQEAEQEYRAAIDANNPGAGWLELAAFYRHTNRIPDMENAIRQAINSEKKRGNVLYESARLMMRAGRNFPDAALLVRKYLSSHNPDEEAPVFQAHFLLGQILEKQGDKKGAAMEYRAALAMAKDYESAQTALKRVER